MVCCYRWPVALENYWVYRSNNGSQLEVHGFSSLSESKGGFLGGFNDQQKGWVRFFFFLKSWYHPGSIYWIIFNEGSHSCSRAAKGDPQLFSGWKWESTAVIGLERGIQSCAQAGMRVPRKKCYNKNCCIKEGNSAQMYSSSFNNRMTLAFCQQDFPLFLWVSSQSSHLLSPTCKKSNISQLLGFALDSIIMNPAHQLYKGLYSSSRCLFKHR